MYNPDGQSGWDWPHIIPRKLILTAFVIFNAITGAAIWIEYYTAAPGAADWFILWKAGGGNASGVWFWLVSGVFLYLEVGTMVLTLMSNRARLKAAVAEAAAEASAKAWVEADRMWREWNERRETAAQEGRDFTEPPPGIPGSGAGEHP
jgi:hypothetical protein